MGDQDEAGAQLAHWAILGRDWTKKANYIALVTGLYVSMSNWTGYLAPKLGFLSISITYAIISLPPPIVAPLIIPRFGWSNKNNG